MALLSRQYAYSKIDNEDPEGKRHRLAQSLIQKVLLQADSRKSPSVRIRICTLKVKIGKRLKKLRKSMLFGISAARVVDAHKRVISIVKTWKRLFHRGETIVSLPSVFT